MVDVTFKLCPDTLVTARVDPDTVVVAKRTVTGNAIETGTVPVIVVVVGLLTYTG